MCEERSNDVDVARGLKTKHAVHYNPYNRGSYVPNAKAKWIYLNYYGKMDVVIKFIIYTLETYLESSNNRK